MRKGKLALTVFALAAAAGLAGAQAPAEPLVVVAPRVELRWSATGRVLGWLGSGARVEKRGGRAGWARVEVRGWLRGASLETSGARARVRPVEDTLRVEPGGKGLGGLRRGVEVRPTGRSGEWTEVVLIGWLPDSAVAPASAPAGEEGRAAAEGPAAEPPAPPAETSPRPAPLGRLARRVEIRAAPEGEALAQLPAGTVVAPLETRGAWTRVSVQGWVPAAAVQAGPAGEAGPEVVAAADPEAFVGRRVTWAVEFVALQRADRDRHDFEPGELFALARVPGRSGLYVYLAVPDRLAGEFRGLAPFRTVRVQGRVRTGRSSLTGNAILDVDRLLP